MSGDYEAVDSIAFYELNISGAVASSYYSKLGLGIMYMDDGLDGHSLGCIELVYALLLDAEVSYIVLTTYH